MLQSGLVTADLTTTVVYSYTLLINDVEPVQSLTHSLPYHHVAASVA